LLAALPEADFARLRPELDTLNVKPKQVLHAQGEQIDFVYFPNTGVFSITTALSDGTRVESATVGNEGMLGISAFFSDDAVSSGEVILQVPEGSADRLSRSAFRRELARGGAFSHLIGRYAQALIAHIMQSTACNAQHAVQERCARWLLLTHDRVIGDEFELSHEFLAVMLGVRRQTVTGIAGRLQESGLIRYTHAHVTILDRKGLEAAACECYAIVQPFYDRLRSVVSRSA
jgi:CRP-like cAMP-binding protein